MSIRPFEREPITIRRLLREMGNDFQRESYILELKDKLESNSLSPHEREKILKEIQNMENVRSNIFCSIIKEIIAPAIDPRR